MLKKLLITVSIFSLAFFFFSCGSNNPFEPANEDYSLYFPLTPGSQWKYVEYPILKDGRKYEEWASYYNAFINSYVTILGKKASEFSFYTPTDTLKHKEYFAFEDNKIYTLLSYFFYFIPQGKEPDRWVVIADFNRKPGEEWMILKDFELYTEQLPPDKGIGKDIYYASLRCRRASDTTFNIKGKVVQATQFKFIYTYRILHIEVGTYPIDFRFDREETQIYWLAKNIGIVQKEYTFPFNFGIDSTLIIDRNHYELIDFTIK